MNNFQEFEKALNKAIEEYSLSEVAYGEIEELEGKKLELVYKHGGGEGGGSSVVRVLKIDTEQGPLFAKFTGYYSSYVGTEWDSEFTQVFPKEKTVTFYE